MDARLIAATLVLLLLAGCGGGGGADDGPRVHERAPLRVLGTRRGCQQSAPMARWYARLGVNRFIDGHSFGIEAMLQGAPDDAGFFGVSQDLDRTVRECAAGVDLLTGKDVMLRVGYSGQFTASGTTHGATLKFTRSF